MSANERNYSDEIQEKHFRIVDPPARCEVCSEVRDLVTDYVTGIVTCLGCLEKLEENRDEKSGLISKGLDD